MSGEIDATKNGLGKVWALHRNSPLPPLTLESATGIQGGRDLALSESWNGREFHHELGPAALLWMHAPGASVVLPEVLFQGTFAKSASPLPSLNFLELSGPEIVLASYSFAKIARDSSFVPALDGLPSTTRELLPANPRLWPGLHFRGKISLNVPAAKEFFPAAMECRGRVCENGPLRFVELECKPSSEAKFLLNPGSDWNLSLERFWIKAALLEESSGIDAVSAKGTLTLGGLETDVELLVDLESGFANLDICPKWTIDLAWLKNVVGREEFAKGAGQVLEGKSGAGEEPGFAATGFAVRLVAVKLAWKPKLTVRALTITLGSPQVNGRPASWKILGGELVASLTGYWNNPPGGKSSFDCSVEGFWRWDGLKFGAALDTRSGEFRAELDFSDQKDTLEGFARKKLFPKAEPAKDEEKAGGPPAGNAGESAEITEIKARLAKPFEVRYFGVTGNYREKSIAVRLETTGYWGFRLRGNDADAHRLDVRFGDLACGGTYDQSEENGAWSLRVEGTFALLRGGDPAALGGGARVTGTFSNKIASELTLTIKSFNIREFVGLLLADEPPKAFPNMTLSDLQIAWKSGEKFTLKCKSDIPIFGPVVLKGMELEVYSGEQKEGEKKANSGSAKIGFGKKLTVDLKVSFEEKQIKFTGSAKDVDVSDLIENFFGGDIDKKDGHGEVAIPEQTVSPGKSPKDAAKDSSRIMAKEIRIELWTARKRKAGAEPEPESEPAEDGKKDDDAAKKLKEGNSLSVTLTVARGDSEIKLLLLAKAFDQAKGDVAWRILFAGNLDLKLKGLPLVGEILGNEADRFAVELHALYLETGAEKNEKPDKAVLDGLLDRGKGLISDEWVKQPPEKDGFAIRAKIGAVPPPAAELPASASTLSQPDEKPSDKILEPKGSTPPEGTDLEWKRTDLKVGPIQLSRIGYGTKKIPAAGDKPEGLKGIVALDGALDLKALRLAVIGLGLEVDIPSFQITPRIEGLAINVRNGPVEITGSLVHRDGTYSGLAQIKTASMTLGAVGRFSLRDNRPSFFIYCVYASPLGGPPAFFVEGFAGGMGYDTRLVLPKVEDVPTFALVESAQKGLGGEPEKQLAAFDAAIVTAPNNLWIAAGVKFSSFKILNSVVVVALSIGDDVEVDIFGVMSLRMPPQIGKSNELLPLVASVDLAIRGKISPAKGEVWLRGQIMPGAFIFDKSCRLVGGFAFQMWFSGEHKGDFVATVGGYHPKFKKPAHYFDVPRFGIDWQLTNEISIKGGAYLAITSRALMAGGRLEMLYQSGSVRASFVAEAHFLAAWAPLHYMADVRLAVDASFTLSVWGWSKEFNVHAAAELHLEGPPFSGTAKIELGPIDISIEFGKAGKPKALTWAELERNFLPKQDSVLSLRSVGLNEAPVTAKTEPPARRRWILTPGSSWEFAVETAIPATSIVVGNVPISLHGVMTDFYAVPTTDKIQSVMTISAKPIGNDTSAMAWTSFTTALGLDVKTCESIVNPAAPALWKQELPSDEKKPEGEDPRLNPAAEKPASGAFGVVLRGQPPELALHKSAFSPSVEKREILSRLKESKKARDRRDANFFWEEEADVYQRKPGTWPAKVA